MGGLESGAVTDGNGSNGVVEGEGPTVTVEEFMQMTDEQKNQLPKARQKKLAKQAEVLKKKAAKAATAPTAQAQSGGTTAKKEVTKKKVKLNAEDLVDHTPKGEKKIMKAMLPAYHPSFVESAWGEWWEAQGFFSVDAKTARNKSEEGKFVMVIPPPNVTGSLHLGHALMATVQDTLTRWHRMHGREALYLPGVDHAGIATQVVVEKQLKKDRGVSRFDLGRDEFVKEVWKWKEEYGDKINRQLRRIGISADWSREEFTLSDKLSRAVKEAFVQFYDRKLMYRATRLVNWCCKLRTAISDIEVDHEELAGRTLKKIPDYDEPVEFGVMVQFAYRVDGSEEELVVATTRIETMLGDVAVAVHPDDDRYKHFIGKKLVHPFLDRKLEVVADPILVDMTKGTGAVKVTPAHDPNDLECGRRHSLEEITIFTENGLLNNQCGQFEGMKRYEARVKVEAALVERGLQRGRKDNPMSLACCSRSGDVIEPMLKPQWWVDCKEMARQAADAVRQGELKIVPDIFEATWYTFLDNIRDWCVSRQLWWGHRIPAYRAQNKSGAEVWVVGRDEKEARERAANELNTPAEEITLQQDEDVLDTWFSSGLFPFSVFGWPDETEDLQAFFPTTLLETGHDILFFWVARMVMMSLSLTGKLPFRTIFLHAMVRDKHGRKMSKSLGNVIDPLEVIDGSTLNALIAKLQNTNLDAKEIKRAEEGQRMDFKDGIPECGADALRYGLLAYTQQARDISLDVQRVVGYRNFCNKLWNATRFAMSNLGESFVFEPKNLVQAIDTGNVMDLFILHRLNEAVRSTEQAMRDFSFASAVTATYNFWLYDLCDVYLEAIKPIMSGEDPDAKRSSQHVLYECLHTGLRLLHPMMPYVTEELFQRLPNRTQSDPIESICISPFPLVSHARRFEEAGRMVATGMEITKAVRNLRAEYDIKPSVRPEVYVLCGSDKAYQTAGAMAANLMTLSQAGKVEVLRKGKGEPPAGCGVRVVNEDTEVHLMLSGLVDFEGEIARLKSAADQKRILIDGYQKKMDGADYMTRVPENVRLKNAEMKEKYEQELATLESLAQQFQQLKVETKKNN